MRGLLYTVSVFAVVALGFWAYREGYETRETERAVDRLQRQIGERHQELSMLRAEWAYLNRPDRLHALAEMNFERLGLMALSSDHFALTEQVGYPLPAAPDWAPELANSTPLDDALSEVIIMNHAYGADAQPRMIAPPSLADDGEQLP
ncbi:cell division protein FtsL [Jannaschia sp. M317]|uniref:cell division protein FtsL n=1 Tax=Jannaschia sp. M317 TaxID=2867011 RepID=UPI0021A35358|nr:cell division protein FtsL [Jannaschia sp. M317]UWQ19328.1 cell division protein FtsL [Jannaschia sp. M317]